MLDEFLMTCTSMIGIVDNVYPYDIKGVFHRAEVPRQRGLRPGLAGPHARAVVGAGVASAAEGVIA